MVQNARIGKVIQLSYAIDTNLIANKKSVSKPKQNGSNKPVSVSANKESQVSLVTPVEKRSLTLVSKPKQNGSNKPVSVSANKESQVSLVTPVEKAEETVDFKDYKSSLGTETRKLIRREQNKCNTYYFRCFPLTDTNPKGKSNLKTRNNNKTLIQQAQITLREYGIVYYCDLGLYSPTTRKFDLSEEKKDYLLELKKNQKNKLEKANQEIDYEIELRRRNSRVNSYST